MSVREILQSGAGRYLRTAEYENNGIELIENDPQEILDVCVEMDERLKGTWQTTDEDEKLQEKFWDIFKPSDLNKVFRCRIGAQFLRENRGILGVG